MDHTLGEWRNLSKDVVSGRFGVQLPTTVVGDDDTIHSLFDGIINILLGGDCNRNMIRLVCRIVYMERVCVFLHGVTVLLSSRARGRLSGFESKK